MTAEVISLYNNIIHDPTIDSDIITDDEIDKARKFVQKKSSDSPDNKFFYDSDVYLFSDVQIAEKIGGFNLDIEKNKILDCILESVSNEYQKDIFKSFDPNEYSLDIYYSIEDKQNLYFYLNNNYINSDGKYNLKTGNILFEDSMLTEVENKGYHLFCIERFKKEKLNIEINTDKKI
jgi:hypothetical protein